MPATDALRFWGVEFDDMLENAEDVQKKVVDAVEDGNYRSTEAISTSTRSMSCGLWQPGNE